MEIISTKTGDMLVVALTGRLDATWADAVEQALASAVKDGEHRIALDLAGVDYISSAGLRVIISGYKQLKIVQGRLDVRDPQPGVRKVIELSGLSALLTSGEKSAAPDAGAAFATSSATWERFGQCAPSALRPVGGVNPFAGTAGELVEFPANRLGLGVAAFASTSDEAAPHLGEFLAVAGCAAQLPAGDGKRPDFLIAEQALVPSAWISSGLVVEGAPRLLLRFEATQQARRISFSEIARAALDATGAPAAVIVMAAETAGLVGASLRRSPAESKGDPFAFPEVRDWLNFTGERAFRDATSIVVGVVATKGGELDSLLRPFGDDLLAHAHAAVFPYRPIRKGAIPLEETVRALFSGEGLQTVLHLLNDTREVDGAGDSEFLRGACWAAPLQSAIQNPKSKME
jgi:anti-anti-sigma factor